MIQVEELYRVRGFDAATVAKLRPFVTALPARTPVNVNTAPREVLAAVLPELSRDGDRAARRSRAATSRSRTSAAGAREEGAAVGLRRDRST